MANQYVGARYTPKFAGMWSQEMTYEQLTVVEYGNGSYISKSPVPAGTLPTNTEYWMLYSVKSSDVEEIEQEIETINTNITAMQSSINSLNTIPRNKFNGANVLWIGDSWSTVTGPVTKVHPQYLSDYLGFNLYNEGSSGTGFTIGTTFQQRMEAWKTNNPDVKIDYVFVQGSINDQPNVGTTLTNAINTFVAKEKELFPNAELIAIPPICNYNLSLPSDRSWWNMFYTVNLAFFNLGVPTIKLPLIFLGYGNYFLSNDPQHPTTQGQEFMAKQILQKLLGMPILNNKWRKLSNVAFQIMTDGLNVELTIAALTTQLPTQTTIQDLKGITINGYYPVLKAGENFTAGELYNNAGDILLKVSSQNNWTGNVLLQPYLLGF